MAPSLPVIPPNCLESRRDVSGAAEDSCTPNRASKVGLARDGLPFRNITFGSCLSGLLGLGFGWVFLR